MSERKLDQAIQGLLALASESAESTPEASQRLRGVLEAMRVIALEILPGQEGRAEELSIEVLERLFELAIGIAEEAELFEIELRHETGTH
jgi:hypothetical protein